MSATTRCRWFSLLVWTRVVLVCLLTQSAIGCIDLRAVGCESDASGVHDIAAASLDAECDLACSHCHGSCVQSIVPSQRYEPVALGGSAAPEARQPQWQPGSPQYPLLRPPALHV